MGFHRDLKRNFLINSNSLCYNKTKLEEKGGEKNEEREKGFIPHL